MKNKEYCTENRRFDFIETIEKSIIEEKIEID